MKEIDWSNLSFGYMKTDYNVRCYYRNGAWGEIEVCSEETIPMHMAATCLHYGQEAFEGLKAYRCPDGKVRVFRIDENAARLQSTCRGILMPEVPTEMFVEMVEKVIRLNEHFIPPYESGATLYIRPLLVGTSAQVGVHPAEEYLFVIFVTPVGPYFRGGFAANPYVIVREYDRSAPLGTGIYKVGGNYAASLRANKLAHDLRVLSRCEGKEVYGRVRCCQFLWNKGQYICYSQEFQHTAQHHKQEPYAVGNGSGHEGGTPSDSRGRTCNFRRSGCLWNGCCYQSYRTHRRPRYEAESYYQQGWTAGSGLSQTL